jgi:hypothetical protein
MRRTTNWLAVGLGLTLTSGCVERRFVVETDPPGAMVQVNGRPLGITPVDGRFDYYGTYHFTIIHEDTGTLQVDQKVPAPVYEYFPIDFFTENLWPFHVQDVRHFRYNLPPKSQPNTDQLLDEATRQRQRGQTLPQEARPLPPPPAGRAPAAPPPGPG